MADKGKDDRKPNDVLFKVSFEGQPKEENEIVAYAFDNQNNLLGSAPVKDGQAGLSLTPRQASRARIFFAPAQPEGKRERPTIESMERQHAYEAVWKFDPRSAVQEILAIPEQYWKYWLLCRCRVRGRVVRPLTIGGATQELAVCRARVHICEVDRLLDIILRVPDDIILRIRDELLLELERPVRFPIPLPDPPPYKFDPRVFDPSPENIAEINRMTIPEASRGVSSGLALRGLNPQPLPPRQSEALSRQAFLPGTIRGFNPQPDPPIERVMDLSVELNPQPEPPGAQTLSTLPLETRIALTSQSSSVTRQALADNVRLILPYLCIWDWFWWWYFCDEVDVVTTDEQGRFDTVVFYPCFVDHPDLYFWVEYFIGGVWTTVYKPSIGCNTYWNYLCGSEVTIRITDPRVIPCSPPPDLSGLQVAIMSIGNAVSMHEIQGSAAGASEGLTTAGEPFGGVLEPHVFFSRTALFAAGITHYRWSFRRLTLSDGATPVPDTWHAMDRDVIRHYAVIDPVTSELSFPADSMGPDPAYPGKNLFRIQPIDPPSPGIDWAVIDAREDSATAFFETHLLAGGNAEAAAGQYELKLELFEPSVSTDDPVNLTAAGVQFKVPTVAAPFGTGTVPTAVPGAEHLILDGSGNLAAFRVVVRVDNNPCEAEIHTVTNPSGSTGLTVDVNCGFIEYSSDAVNAHIAFRARHRHNFANFSFTIFRGNSIFVPEASASGSVGASPLNGFVRNASSVYSKDVSVQTLLTSNKPPLSPDCRKAAFAENLYVSALATDGWSRLSYLDASGLPKAFALAPHP